MEGALLHKEGRAKKMSLLCLKYWCLWNRFSQTEWAGDLLQCLEDAGGLLYSKAKTYVKCSDGNLYVLGRMRSFICCYAHKISVSLRKVSLGIQLQNNWLHVLEIVIAHFWLLKSTDLPFIGPSNLSWSTWFINIRELEWRLFIRLIVTVAFDYISSSCPNNVFFSWMIYIWCID